jgi:hypothetical protein
MAWSACHGLERRRLVPAAAAVAGGASIGLVMILPWLRQSGNAVAGKAPGLSSHGFAELGLQLGPPNPAGLLEFLLLNKWGLLLVIAGFLLGRRQRLRAHLAQITQAAATAYSQKFLSVFVALSAFIWLGCYFLSTSIDYRFILAMPAVVIVYSLLAQRIRTHGFLSSAGLVLTALTITLLNPIPGISIGANAATVALAVCIDRFSDSIVLPLLAGSLLAMVAPELPRLHRAIPDRPAATTWNQTGPGRPPGPPVASGPPAQGTDPAPCSRRPVPWRSYRHFPTPP